MRVARIVLRASRTSYFKLIPGENRGSTKFGLGNPYSGEERDRAVQGLDKIRTRLDFLVILASESKNETVKVGDTYTRVIKKAIEVVDTHPKILSSLFNVAEFKQGYQLAVDLVPIRNKLNELNEACRTLSSRRTAMRCSERWRSGKQFSGTRIRSPDRI